MRKMVLIEGEVTFKVKVSTLVDKETAQNEDRVKEIFEKLGNSDVEYFAECMVECDDGTQLYIDEDNERYIEDSLSSDLCKEIIDKSKELADVYEI